MQGIDFTSDLLADLDEVRSVAGDLGLRPFEVRVRVRRWDGERPGVGGYTDAPDVLLTNLGADGFTRPVRVKQRSRAAVIASGGQFTDREYIVGPMTSPFPGGGYDEATLDPAATNAPTEVFWNIRGPGLPPDGAWCDQVSEEATALHRTVTLRANGKQP